MNRYQIQLLRALKTGPKSFWKLLDAQDDHIRSFVSRLRALIEEEIVTYRGGVFLLTDKGREFAAGISTFKETTCSSCRGGYLSDFSPEAREKYSRLIEGRPLPNPNFDQGFMSVEDVFARVAFMYQRGDLEWQKILILGDDDLFSLALAATGLPEEITVLEVDRRLVQFIENQAQAEDLPIRVLEYNACSIYPLEEHFFDVFITDPVESEKGLKVTLSRGAQGLRTDGALYFGLTTIESSWKKWYKIEKMLLEMNLVVTDILRRFSAYPDLDNQFDETYYNQMLIRRLLPGIEVPLPADTDWFRSSLVRCEAVATPSPLVVEAVEFDSDFYLDQETLATPLVEKDKNFFENFLK
ncbi:MAG: N4-bis(aminopropyl)spermidine synthase [Candidatus Atribacteria bacterium]|nr:N4-bis(aminopropyl)spermidine synthase [Candidatus Atribacteria bacterium]